MKKNYTVSLDKEEVELVLPYLEKQGLSFSGFLNQSVVEYARALRIGKMPENISDMKLGDFLKVFSRMIRGLKEEK